MRTLKAASRIRLLAVPAILAVTAVGFGAHAADAATTAATAAKPVSASVVPQSHWVSGGQYPTSGDCNTSGRIAISQSGGFYLQYRCPAVFFPDGSIEYWQLWLLQFN
jgi:hypothetical protein